VKIGKEGTDGVRKRYQYSPYARCTPLGKDLDMSGERGGGEMQVNAGKSIAAANRRANQSMVLYIYLLSRTTTACGCVIERLPCD